MGLIPPHAGTMLRHFVGARRRWRSLRGGALMRYQDERARATVAYAAEHAPFYRAHWAGRDLADWRSLPVVDKQLMMDHFDTFNTVGLRREEAMEVALRAERTRDFRGTARGATIGLSSGTSGHRGLFAASAEEQAGWAGAMLARAVHRFSGRLRVAFFLRSNSNLYEQIGGLFIQFRYFDLMLPLEEAVARLNLLQPHIVVGPPSLLGFLADARATGELRIQPTRLVAVAEVLEPQDKRRLESIFAAPVHQIYQCTEGLLAISCARGALHIQEDIVALQFEPLADAGDTDRLTPIVTDLWRRTQPIIRYRLNDVVRLDPAPCECGSGFRVLAAIEGRCDDVCYFDRADGMGALPFFPDTIRRMVLLADARIQDYQATQERTGRLRIALTLAERADGAAVDAAVRASVAETVSHYGARLATLEITHELAPDAPGVKRRRVRRLG